MMNGYYRILFVILCLSIFSCQGLEKGTIKRNKNNFSISIYDSDITNPDTDRRCYYIVYIDKIESGRTTTGLESQEKYFETVLTPNRHLIKVEKWLLNESLGRYLKMNNIDQPKPDFIYITINEDKSVAVKLKSSKSGIASYSLATE